MAPKHSSQGLHKLGYIEGQTIVIEPRHAADRAERLPDLAAELVRLNVDVIGAGFAKRAGCQASDQNDSRCIPRSRRSCGQGPVPRLARPGGNVPGLASLSPEVGGKRLQLFKETVPSASRVADVVESD